MNEYQKFKKYLNEKKNDDIEILNQAMAMGKSSGIKHIMKVMKVDEDKATKLLDDFVKS